MNKRRRAIISVSDKTGIADLARGLIEIGFEIVSTGGTANVLKEAGIPVTLISEVSGFPEILDGRVKTLHPLVFGGLLARTDEPTHQKQINEQGIIPIQVVIVNLYPFEATISRNTVTLEEAIENIDIGGPSLLRAAAKNYQDVTVIVDPNDYKTVLNELVDSAGTPSLETRAHLATKVFQHTAYYDSLIARYLGQKTKSDQDGYPDYLTLGFEKADALRYGENPHQKAAFYREKLVNEANLGQALQLGGKALSFNNFVDLEAALAIIKDFDEPAVAFIKHTNPCGLASSETIESAYQKAYQGDPLSAYGSIVGINRRIEPKLAELINETPFVEAIVAPSFSPEALKILKQKKNRRLIQVGDLRIQDRHIKDIKKISGGILIQDRDLKTISREQLTCITQKKPEEVDIKALLFAWKTVKHVKSNAIVLVKDHQLVGVGAGQMSRVDSVKIAVRKAGERASGSYLASDAFFPFSDGVEEAVKAGVKAIIQPGGSKRDPEVIKAADQLGVIMLMTGSRSFKH